MEISITHALKKALNKRSPQNLKLLSQLILGEDKQTKKHSRRITFLVDDYAKYLGLNQRIRDILCASSLLHDIGKLTITDIASQPKKLTEDEYKLVRMHVYAGYLIAKELGVRDKYIRAIFNHHQQQNSQYYVQKEEILEHQEDIKERINKIIPITDENMDKYTKTLFNKWETYNRTTYISNVICLWDSFDAAIGFDRTYKDTKTLKEVISEFNGLFGTQFDKKLQGSFQKYIESEEFNQLYNRIYK